MALLVDNLIVLKTLSKSIAVAGIRLGYAISNEEIINELQLTRPSGVPSCIVAPILPDLFELIPDHVKRMLKARNFLEATTECIPSQGNFVILKELPEGFENHFIVRTLSENTYRMALTNLKIILDACG